MRTVSQILCSCGSDPKPSSLESPAKQIDSDNGYSFDLSDADTQAESLGRKLPALYTTLRRSRLQFVQSHAQSNHDLNQLLDQQRRAEFVHGF